MPWNVAVQSDFTGGENQAELYNKVQRNQLRVLQNCLIDPLGFITSDFQTSDKAITSNYSSNGFGFFKEATGNYTVYASYGGDGSANCVFEATYNSTTNAALNVATFTKHTISGGTTGFLGLHKVTPFLSKRYIPNTEGQGIINLTDYALITNGSLSTGNVKHIREYTNRLWAVKIGGALVCSNNGDAATWDALNIIYLPNRDQVMDFIPVQGGAIVVGTYSVYAMYGSDYTDITFVKIADDINIVPDSSVQVGNSVFAHGLTKIYRFSLNGMEVVPMEQYTYFNTHLLLNQGNTVYRARGVYLPKREMVMFYYPPGATIDGIDVPYALCIDLKSGATTKTYLPATNILAIDTQDVEFLTYVAGEVYYGFTPVTSRVNKVALIKTRFEDFDTSKDKVIRKLSITVSGEVTAVSISYTIDDIPNVSYTVATDITLAAGKNNFYIHSSNNRCRNISFTISINNGTFFKITELGVKYLIVGETK